MSRDCTFIYNQQKQACGCVFLCYVLFFDCLLSGLTQFSSHSLLCPLCHLSLLRLLLCVSCQVLDIIYDLVLCPDCETPDKTSISATNAQCLGSLLCLSIALCVQVCKHKVVACTYLASGLFLFPKEQSLC